MDNILCHYFKIKSNLTSFILIHNPYILQKLTSKNQYVNAIAPDVALGISLCRA